MALPRQSTGLILNLPSKNWCAIAYVNVDLDVRKNAQPVGCQEPGVCESNSATEPDRLPLLSQRRHSSKTSRGRSRFCVVAYKRRGVKPSTPESRHVLREWRA